MNDHDPEDGKTLLHIAAEKGNERIIFELAGNEPGFEAFVDAVDKRGNTPLHTAATKCKASAARFLMSLGAVLEAQNETGSSPLHLAVQSENLRTTKDLLLKGANRKSQDSQDNIPENYIDTIEDAKLKKSFKAALVSLN